MHKLEELRKKLEERNLGGMIIPMTDPFQNDFIPEYYHRIKFLSGFTGSLGTVVVLKNSAALFVDGRYTLQAQAQVNQDLFEVQDHGIHSIMEWILQKNPFSPAPLVLGYDPWDYTVAQINQLQSLAEGFIFSPIQKNPIDEIWDDHPNITKTKIFLYPEKYVGLSWIEKLNLVTTEIERRRLDALFLTSAASLCWLFNIRGHDVPYTPITLCYALIHKDGKVDFFSYLENLTPSVVYHFSSKVTFHKMSGVDLENNLPGLVKSLKIGYTEQNAPIKIKQILEPACSSLVNTEDPCVLLKSCKTPTEISFAKKAHMWDGVALVKFFYWLEKNVPCTKITEFEAGVKVDSLRALNENFKGPSFPTIAGSNQNAAVVHYRANKESQTLKVGDLFLCDSGGQYFEGTTDVTRTVSIGGNPTAFQKALFTRVLKGFISLFLIRFPVGTTGSQLDVLSRRFLWEIGLDYAHSTGHGVGHYLGVHEGPQNISYRPSMVALKPGMIISNEPGCYLPGQFGIRIENLMVVEESPYKDTQGNFLLRFRNLTLCPIDQSCIDIDLLSEEEIAWLNTYHQETWSELNPLLDSNEKTWLKKITAPLSKKS